jgi:hypothetical protein
MCANLIVQFHAYIHKFHKVLWFFGLVNKACLEFLGKTTFEGSLLCITIIVPDGHQTLELCRVLAEFFVSLSELVEVHRSSSHLVRVTKGGLQNRDEYFHILKVDFIGEDIRLNLVLCHGVAPTLLIAPFDLGKGPFSIAMATGISIVMVVALATSLSTSSGYCLA